MYSSPPIAPIDKLASCNGLKVFLKVGKVWDSYKMFWGNLSAERSIGQYNRVYFHTTLSWPPVLGGIKMFNYTDIGGSKILFQEPDYTASLPLGGQWSRLYSHLHYWGKVSFVTSWSSEQQSSLFKNRRVWRVWKSAWMEIFFVLINFFSRTVVNKDSNVTTDTGTSAESQESV